MAYDYGPLLLLKFKQESEVSPKNPYCNWGVALKKNRWNSKQFFSKIVERIAGAILLLYLKTSIAQRNKSLILFMQTRLFRIIRQIIFNSTYQFHLFQNVFTASIFYLFIGFVTGSGFCTILSFIRETEIWDGFVIFFLIVFFEKIGKQVYRRTQTTQSHRFLKFLNCWKTGILLGFFVDAFKVGS